MKISECHLGFIGFGHMAQIICRSVEQSRLLPRSQISFIRRDPAKMKQNEQEFRITSTTLKNLVEQSNILLLCVRPHQADSILKELASLGVGSKMIVSILAGIKLSFFQKYLGSTPQLLRALPNTASAVGEGMTVFSYGASSSIEFQSLTNLLFSSMGEVMEVSEDLMDISCAIGGSGPGFVFRLIESMARAGEKQGLSYEKALRMAAQVFAGAARLILKGSIPETLIQQIATPNGTTEAGFRAMEELQIERHFQAVVEACANRSKQISEEFF